MNFIVSKSFTMIPPEKQYHQFIIIFIQLKADKDFLQRNLEEVTNVCLGYMSIYQFTDQKRLSVFVGFCR